ncbi:MAG: hypothetical protein ACFFB2_00075 [Promethearchaeota archaeon]
MVNNEKWKEYLLKISIFGHPDELVNPLIHKLVQTYPRQVTLNLSSESENIYILQIEIENWRLTIYLVQPVSQYLIDKLPSHYYTEIAGSIILFSNDNLESFKAARTFYHQVRKVNGNLPVLVTFIEVIDSINIPIIDEPEVLSSSPNVIYYGIRENDEEAFSKIIETFVSRYFGFQE